MLMEDAALSQIQPNAVRRALHGMIQEDAVWIRQPMLAFVKIQQLAMKITHAV